MAKPPRVIGVLTEPAPASWWKRNRHIVTLCVGVFLGFQLCGVSEADHTPEPAPAPSHTGDASVQPLLPEPSTTR
ncbi:hypothetical protein [Streptomyces sp. NBC_00467]|uniref:hypothetical protein n=1 Tax=Streptomyces sp. NBC_00467 TaxID=2975752 RepID=UPI002E178679